MIARTAATGAGGLAPEVLRFSSSLAVDRGLLREDLIGSLAHATMLGRVGLIPAEELRQLRAALVALLEGAARGDLPLPDEEDVHMAVEVELTHRLGPTAGRLHTARSRNDQVALDLRLHVREQLRLLLSTLADLIDTLVSRGRADAMVLLPAYTHRQPAQAITGGYYFAGLAAGLARDGEVLAFALEQVDVLPLGVGAIAGTSLPTDRNLTRALLGFSRVSLNGLDTVGDRDFALDFLYAISRCHVHLSRLATEVIDFSGSAFGFLKLGDQIACGSSLMPHKKNPDLFELVRGKASLAIGDLMQLFCLVKGLPAGYNRDLQEDRRAILEAGPRLRATLEAVAFGLAHVQFDPARTRAAVDSAPLQAVDVAEALVTQGVPFRTAYVAVGALVEAATRAGIALSQVTPDMAARVHPLLSGLALQSLDPSKAVARKESLGGTGPKSVAAQLAALEASARALSARADSIPSLEALAAKLSAPEAG